MFWLKPAFAQVLQPVLEKELESTLPDVQGGLRVEGSPELSTINSACWDGEGCEILTTFHMFQHRCLFPSPPCSGSTSHSCLASKYRNGNPPQARTMFPRLTGVLGWGRCEEQASVKLHSLTRRSISQAL